MFLGTKHDLREWARSCPLTLALSPNTENVLGEREQMAGLVTQGTPSGSCRWGLPGLPSDAPNRWGSIRKKRRPAASQMSNLPIQTEVCAVTYHNSVIPLDTSGTELFNVRVQNRTLKTPVEKWT